MGEYGKTAGWFISYEINGFGGIDLWYGESAVLCTGAGEMLIKCIDHSAAGCSIEVAGQDNRIGFLLQNAGDSIDL